MASGGGAGGTGQGSPGNAAVGGADALKQGVSQGEPSSSSGAGSSPLVPILIAIALLAATSVGVFLLRQRRQRTGAFSPEAG